MKHPLEERVEEVALEHLADAGTLPDPRDVAQWLVEERAAQGEYSGLVDDGDKVRRYKEGEYSVTAMEIDFTEIEAVAKRVIEGGRR